MINGVASSTAKQKKYLITKMKIWHILLVVVICLALVFFLKKNKKERFSEQTMFLQTPRLRPVLRGQNEETMDVLAYSLGGLDAPKRTTC